MPDPARETDLHIHTHHSYCASSEMTLENIAKRAVEAGLAVVGLSDHAWLDLERGCRPAIAHLLETRKELAARDWPVTFMLGVEADCAPGRGAAGGDDIKLLEYSIGSYHFAEVRENLVPPPGTPEKLAGMLAEGFRSVVESTHITLAGHPLHIPRRIYRSMTDGMFDHLAETYRMAIELSAPHLATAASRGIAIEINSHALFPRIRAAMLPFFTSARNAGCRFAVSSDAHRPGEVGRGRAQTLEYARSAGITPGLLLDAGSIQRHAGR